MSRRGFGAFLRAASGLFRRPRALGEDLFRSFFEDAPLALACVSAENGLVALNRRFVAEFGYSRTDLPDMDRWWALAYPDPAYRETVCRSWEEAVRRAREGGTEVEAGTYLVRRKDGTSGAYLIGASLVKGHLLASLVDVSRLMEAEEATSRSERSFAALFEEAPLPLAIFDREGRGLRYNRRFASILGYPLEEYGSLAAIWDRAYPDPAVRADLAARWSEAAKPDGAPFEATESCLRTARGEELVVLINTSALPDGTLVSLLDITERKRAEVALAESLERYRALSEASMSGIWQVGLDRCTVYANPAMQKLLGVRSAEELAGICCFDFFAPESRDKAMAGFESRLRGQSTSYETVLLGKDGTRRDVILSGAPLYGAGREVIGTIASLVDISDRKRAEAALGESLRLYRTLSETAPMGIWLIDRDNRTIYANPVMRSFVGYSPEENVVGLDYEVFFAPECREWVRYEHEKRAKGEMSTYEATLIDRQSKRREVLVAGAPLRGAEGEVVGTIGSLVDITDLKRAEALLRKGEERLRSLVSILQSKAESGQAFIEKSLTEVLELTDSAFGYIYLYDEETRQFTLNSWSRDVMPACRVANPRSVYDLDSTGIWGEAVRQRRAIVVNDFAAANPLKKGYPEGHVELRRFLTVPVFSGERIVAVVGAANKAEPYDESDVLQIQLLMDGVWKGLARREAEERLRTHEHRLREYNEGVLDLVVHDLLTSGDLFAALRGITELACRLTGVGRASVWSYAQDNRSISCADAFDAGTATHTSGEVLCFADFPNYSAAHLRGEMIIARDVSSDPRTSGIPASYIEEHRIRSLIDAPVLLGPHIRGILSLEAIGSERLWDPEDERLATMLATAVSLAFQAAERRHAEEDLRALNAELERKVKERTDDLANANLELQAANVGLAKAMEELKEAQAKVIVSEKLAALGGLMAGIAHELNTPLAAIAASARYEAKALGEGLDTLAVSASHLSAEEMKLLAKTRRRVVSSGRSATVEAESERRARREAARSLAAAGVPGADGIAEDLVELGLADLASELAPAFAGPRREDFLGLLRGVIGSYRAALVSADAVDKAVRVVSALRTYARSGEDEEATRIRLAPEIRGLLDLYYNQTKRGIELAIDMDEDLEIVGRREALNRVWFNLLNNAIQACGGRGRVEISARFEGADLLVSIADTGSGIPESNKGRIFEPFFTTKPAGQGTGLGLDIARRLAREHGGDISFVSSPGRTVFTVRLPQPERKPSHGGKDEPR